MRRGRRGGGGGLEKRRRNKGHLKEPSVWRLDNSKFGILGQVWYLIVSIPYLCTLTYFGKILFEEYSQIMKLRYATCLGNNINTSREREREREKERER